MPFFWESNIWLKQEYPTGTDQMVFKRKKKVLVLFHVPTTVSVSIFINILSFHCSISIMNYPLSVSIINITDLLFLDSRMMLRLFP